MQGIILRKKGTTALAMVVEPIPVNRQLIPNRQIHPLEQQQQWQPPGGRVNGAHSLLDIIIAKTALGKDGRERENERAKLGFGENAKQVSNQKAELLVFGQEMIEEGK